MHTRHHTDLLAPLREEEEQGNGSEDPERAFRRCIELVRRISRQCYNLA